MAVLPQAQWEQQYPYHTISYQEYVKQQTAAEGSSPASQSSGQQTVQNSQSNINVQDWFNRITGNGTKYPDQALINQVYGLATDDNSRSQISNLTNQLNSFIGSMNSKASNPTASDPNVVSFLQSSPNPQALANYQRMITVNTIPNLTKDQKSQYLNTGDPTYLKGVNSTGKTLTQYYNEQRGSGLSFDQIKAKYNTLGGTSQNNSATYNPSSTITPLQGGDPGNTGTPVDQSQGATYNAGSTTPTNQTVNGQPVSGTSTNNDAAMQALMNSPYYQGLPEDWKSMLRIAVKGWEPGTELNMENVLTELDKVKTKTFDPHFAEQVSTFKKNINDQYQTLQSNRSQELETQGINAQNAVRDSQANLEGSGMTFSGEANNQLGNRSAYIPFAGQPEGQVNTNNRLMASSSLARNQANIKALGLAAEQSLGNQMGSGLVPGYSPLGISTGSIEQNKKEMLGSTLDNILTGAQQNNSYKQPIDFSSFRNIFTK